MAKREPLIRTYRVEQPTTSGPSRYCVYAVVRHRGRLIMAHTVTIKMTSDDYCEARNEYVGYCISCGAEHYQIEPDARNYLCEECEERQVFGIEELLMGGQLEIVEETDADQT